jgi:hypothetical protein
VVEETNLENLEEIQGTKTVILRFEIGHPPLLTVKVSFAELFESLLTLSKAFVNPVAEFANLTFMAHIEPETTILVVDVQVDVLVVHIRKAIVIAFGGRLREPVTTEVTHELQNFRCCLCHDRSP